MTYLMNQLIHQIKDVRDPEDLVRIMPSQLRQAYQKTQAYFPNNLFLEILEFEEEQEYSEFN